MEGAAKSSKHTDYSPGSIKKMHLVNFMTHKDVTFIPSSRINLVLGANGSGKSSLVCAFCLGLGGSVNDMQRATTLPKFILQGKKHASIETTLCAHPGNPDIVIRREFSTESSSSQWYLQGEKCTEKAVRGILTSLGIDMGNMTQFLPQEKITDFTKLDPQTLLNHVEMALGGGLAEEHAAIILDHKSAGDDAKKMALCQRKIDGLRGELDTLKLDKDRFEEFMALDEKLKLLDDRKLFVRAVEARQEADQARADMDTTKKELELAELNKKQQLLLEPESTAAELSSQAKKSCLQAEARVSDSMKGLKNLTELTVKGKHNATVSALEGSLRNILHNREETTNQLSAMEKKLSSAREALKEASSLPIPSSADIEKLKAANSAAALAKSQAQTALAELADQATPVERQLDSVRRQLRNAQDIPAQRLASVIQGMGQQVGRLADWIRGEGKSKFKSPNLVFGPIAAHVEMPDATPLQKAMFEQQVGRNVQSGFVVSNEADRQVLKAYMEAHNIRTMLMMVDPNRAQDDIDTFSKKKHSIAGSLPAIKSALGEAALTWMDTLVRAPPMVLAALHRDGQIWRFIMHSGNVAPLVSSNATIPSGFTLLGTDAILQSMPSRSGQAYTQRGYWNRELRPSYMNIQQDQARIDKMKGDVAALEKSLSDIQGRLKTAEGAKAEADKAAAEAIKKMQDSAGRLNNHRRLTQTVEKLQKEVTELQNALHSEDAAEAAAKSALSNLRAAQMAYLKDLGQVFDTVSTVLTACGAEAVAAASRAHADTLKRDYEETKRLIRARVSEITRSKESSEAIVAKHLERSEAYNKEAEAKKAKYSDQQKLVYNSLPKLMDELEAMIYAENARYEQLKEAGELDRAILKKYTSKSKELEAEEAALASLQVNVSDLEAQRNTRQDEFTKKVQVKAKKLNANFKANMSQIGCSGNVEFDTGTEPSKWGLRVKVGFRAHEMEVSKMRQLGEGHSGGEKAVSTMLLLLSMQDLTSLPFRIVDEINQGIDANNESAVMRALAALYDNVVDGPGAAPLVAAEPKQLPAGKQLFIITPKLLPKLFHAPSMRSSIVFNGPEVSGPKAMHTTFLSFCDLAKKSEAGSLEGMKGYFDHLVAESNSRSKAAVYTGPAARETVELGSSGAGAAGASSTSKAIGVGGKRKREEGDDDEEEGARNTKGGPGAGGGGGTMNAEDDEDFEIV